MDLWGLVVEAVALPASAHDNATGIALLNGVAVQTDTVRKALVDQDFKGLLDHGMTLAVNVETLERNPSPLSVVVPAPGASITPWPPLWR